MVKVNKPRGSSNKENKNKIKSKMSSEVDHRRSSGVSSHVNLRRSKSVRESLRIIGTKFLHHRHDVQKSPSLTNITDEDNNYQKFIYENGGIQTILKTPMDKPIFPKNKNYFKNLDFLHKNKQTDFLVSDIPETIAPKAAALLEIPLKENVSSKTSSYAMYKAKRCSKLSESDVDKIEEEDIIEELKMHDSNFSRNSFRLSMSTKRKNWSSFTSSTSSMYSVFLFYVFFYHS